MFEDQDFRIKKNREILELNLTPLIDAFTVIVLFLILGAVFSKSDISIPKSMLLPQSKSDSSAHIAQQIIVHNGKVKFSKMDKEFLISDFYNGAPQVRAAIKKYFSGIPQEKREAATELNFTTDLSTPYKTIFDIIKVLREEGFETLLFVAEGEQK